MLKFLSDYLFNHTPLLYLTQSLWRDEAFSVLTAEPGGLESIKITANDYNPPLYYLILHFWMRLFGKSEIAIRLLSFTFYLGFLYFFYHFAKKLFLKKWATVALAFASVCPILIYYSFEARMYSLYALTTTASMYFFYTKKWKPYIITTTLALYTHPYTVFIPLVQGLYLLITKKLNRKIFSKILLPFLFYLPWIFVIINQFKNTAQMWIYPIDLNLITSVLANLLIGYEGTPGFLWPYTKIISFFLIILYLSVFLQKKIRQKYLLFFLWVFLPLAIVLSFSYFKPIFVNRYLITISVAQLFLITIAIQTLLLKNFQKLLSVLILALFVFFLFYLPPFIKKINIRNTFVEINSLARQDDLVFAGSPLVFFESLYYFPNRQHVFLYNPSLVKLPAYLGTILIPQNKQATTFPPYPGRAFLIYENGSYELFSSLSK